MMAEAKVKKWGNSLGLIIPKDVVKFENLQVNDTIKVEISKEKRLDGFGMFKNLPSFKKEKISHDEFW